MSGMSQEEARREVQALLYRISELENYINQLNSTLNALLREIEEIRLARSAIDAVKETKDVSVLIALDRRGHVFAQGTVTSGDKFITHIGSEYYALLPPEKTLKILDEKENDLRKAITTVQTELSKASKLYENLQRTLATLAEASRQKGS